jgi:phosphopantothenoylcysteine decarboxylase/phosphopantothenate--cysteine ligase
VTAVTGVTGATAEPAPRRRVVLGVAGGIAAYKAVEVLRRLTESGHEVRVVPTAAALRFVGEPTWAALSGHKVATDVWTDAEEVAHVRLGRWADLVLIVPSTADLLARAATGRADDLITNVLLTTRAPTIYAPAMHTEMWEHPATQANVATLRARGAVVIEPAVGRLTGPDSGAGRLPEPVEIAGTALTTLARLALGSSTEPDFAGRRVLVSAGGTREAIDPVRFLGNASSGRQGYAFARAAVARGAAVTVVAANVSLPPVAGAAVVPVTTAAEMAEAVRSRAATADVVVMAAAVADFRPVQPSAFKIKKDDREPEPIRLTRNPDILAGLLAERAPGQVLVGFAAETGSADASVEDLGRAKLARKPVDLLVVNAVGDGRGFEVEDNAATVLSADGTITRIELTSKDVLAHRVLDLVYQRFSGVAAVTAGAWRR